MENNPLNKKKIKSNNFLSSLYQASRHVTVEGVRSSLLCGTSSKCSSNPVTLNLVSSRDPRYLLLRSKYFVVFMEKSRVKDSFVRSTFYVFISLLKDKYVKVFRVRCYVAK